MGKLPNQDQIRWPDRKRQVLRDEVKEIHLADYLYLILVGGSSQHVTTSPYVRRCPVGVGL